uniref:ATP synthase F0 subunit 8 n=1 Tax=Sabella spallanzanii TaxID=85702 RepID=A0A7T1SSG7_SABSP|nr:ATP synthase F0 subunit 8 [Sabella spallanzanii]QPO99960.1 ATP synthase F0 subunit 8 [Sabella spallanzanii]UJM44182.1 ATP synthase F0 subunit 8 [Sabella spallanzanii]UYP50926.1 ATP synthase F0 subunit 8 [Sabella spallanzanii]
MPHLSPLSWILVPLVVIIGAGAVFAVLWWSQVPEFKSPGKGMQLNVRGWHWA